MATAVKLQRVSALPVERTTPGGRYWYEGGSSLFRPYRTVGEDTCDYSTPLDAYWKVLLWRLRTDNSFSTIDPICPPHLELLVERIPKITMPEDYRKFVSKNLLDEAMRKSTQDYEWEYLMWESVRIYPAKNNLTVWLDYLQKSNYDEYFHFKRLYDSLSSAEGVDE